MQLKSPRRGLGWGFSMFSCHQKSQTALAENSTEGSISKISLKLSSDRFKFLAHDFATYCTVRNAALA